MDFKALVEILVYGCSFLTLHLNCRLLFQLFLDIAQNGQLAGIS